MKSIFLPFPFLSSSRISGPKLWKCVRRIVGRGWNFLRGNSFFLSRFFLWYSDYKLRIVIENWFVRIWRNETTEFLNNIFKRKSMEKREGKFCGGWFDLPVKRSCSIRNCIGFFLIVTQEILFNGNLLTLLPNNFTRSFARNSPIISFGRKTIRLYAARISQRFQEKKPFYDISVTGHWHLFRLIHICVHI